LRVDNFEGAASQDGGLALSERRTQLLRNRKKQEREIHCRECKEGSWGLHAVASKSGATRTCVEAGNASAMTPNL
jgi:hypothetical protein